MSGLASLFLQKYEIDLVDSHYKVTLENLQKLHPRTPRSVVYFLGGSLPGTAILHMRQLSLFGMICLLLSDPLNQHARHILMNGQEGPKSWFFQIRDITQLYSLPHPLQLLEAPLPKESLKKLVKSRVLDYWESKLRSEALKLEEASLKFFKPNFMSLAKPHSLWTTAGCSPYETAKATIQARMLSGRFRTEELASHWSDNKEGLCLSPNCEREIEDIEHILVGCIALEPVRTRLRSSWQTHAIQTPYLHQLINLVLVAPKQLFCQFLLDPSVHPEVISAEQRHGRKVLTEVFYLSRTWCYLMHKERLKMQRKWNLKM